jgi:hypothetical protein
MPFSLLPIFYKIRFKAVVGRLMLKRPLIYFRMGKVGVEAILARLGLLIILR